jgi:hypothetical protein
MPGPFPGMDPWLESPEIWKGFHDAIVMKTVEVLQPLLNRLGYFIGSGERVWVVEDERSIWPNHLIFHEPSARFGQPTSGTAVADDPILIARLEEEETREIFAEIRTVSDRQLVTTIEFLSPANKADSNGRQVYQQKQRELRDAGVHLVEVDLLRSGPNVLEVPEAVLEGIRPWNYIVNVSRRGSRDYELYPIRLHSRLPRVRIPLKAEDQDAVLDLQEVVDRAYDIGAYPIRINYNKPPWPPLGSDDAQWAAEILKSHGLRK